jgi:predicted  nucleic acid-binding Zn-ribbon protein
MTDLDISTEFIEENKANLCQFMPNSRRGPYSKYDKEARRNEVYKFHFEYGYSARKIAELMKINRNTVNADLQYWYSKAVKRFNIFNPEQAIILSLQRLEIQRTRLREQLDKVTDNTEQIQLERLIYDVDCKILQTHHKLSDSSERIHRLATQWLNEHMKKHRKDERYLSYYDAIKVSDKAHQRINKIIDEDRRSVMLR